MLLFLLGSCSAVAVEKTINKDNSQKLISTTQNIKTTKYITIDVLAIPNNGQPIVADPITLSLATDTLDLLVFSSVYPNTYPGTLGKIFAGESKGKKFRVSNLDHLDQSLLSYDLPPETDSDEAIQIWRPVSTGNVTLKFYGDLVVEKGELFQSAKIKHVVVKVPVNIVE